MISRSTLYLTVILVPVFTLLVGAAAAADVSLEKDMQQTLTQARAIVTRMQAGLEAQTGIERDLYPHERRC